MHLTMETGQSSYPPLTLTLTLTLTLIIVYFDNSTTKSNNQCSTFRINTNSFNVERHGDHIKTYIHVDIT